ncbi:MAG: hypothetical protein AAFV51_14885, partial [Pseudomonadota bacterium]
MGLGVIRVAGDGALERVDRFHRLAGEGEDARGAPPGAGLLLFEERTPATEAASASALPANHDDYVETFVKLATSRQDKEREAAALEAEGKTTAAYDKLAELAVEEQEQAGARWRAAGVLAFASETVKAID